MHQIAQLWRLSSWPCECGCFDSHLNSSSRTTFTNNNNKIKEAPQHSSRAQSNYHTTLLSWRSNAYWTWASCSTATRRQPLPFTRFHHDMAVTAPHHSTAKPCGPNTPSSIVSPRCCYQLVLLLLLVVIVIVEVQLPWWIFDAVVTVAATTMQQHSNDIPEPGWSARKNCSTVWTTTTKLEFISRLFPRFSNLASYFVECPRTCCGPRCHSRWMVSWILFLMIDTLTSTSPCYRSSLIYRTASYHSSDRSSKSS